MAELRKFLIGIILTALGTLLVAFADSLVISYIMKYPSLLEDYRIEKLIKKDTDCDKPTKPNVY